MLNITSRSGLQRAACGSNSVGEEIGAEVGSLQMHSGVILMNRYSSYMLGIFIFLIGFVSLPTFKANIFVYVIAIALCIAYIFIGFIEISSQ